MKRGYIFHIFRWLEFFWSNILKPLPYNNHLLNVLLSKTYNTHLWMSCCDFCMDAIEASICARSFISLLHRAHWLPKPKTTQHTEAPTDSYINTTTV